MPECETIAATPFDAQETSSDTMDEADVKNAITKWCTKALDALSQYTSELARLSDYMPPQRLRTQTQFAPSSFALTRGHEYVTDLLVSLGYGQVRTAEHCFFAGQSSGAVIDQDETPDLLVSLHREGKWEDVALVLKSDRLKKSLTPGKMPLFSCKGKIDAVGGQNVYATLYRNDSCDDPVGIELSLGDFGDSAAEALPGRWFSYQQYRQRIDVTTTDLVSRIKLLPERYYSDDETISEYERLLAELPDEF